MSKPPIPLIGQRALLMDILEHANPAASLALTFLFETYFRVSEGLATTAGSAIPAAPSTAGASQSVAILALPSEKETTGKTGETDLSVLLDLPRQKKLGLVLELLAATKKGGGRLLPISYDELRKALMESSARLGLTGLHMTLHGLRHGAHLTIGRRTPGQQQRYSYEAGGGRQRARSGAKKTRGSTSNSLSSPQL